MRGRGSRRGFFLPVLTSLLTLATGAAAPRASVQETVDPTVSEQIRQAGLTDTDSEDLARWHHGPVRYLLRGPELTFYRSLTTDEDRLAFIRLFWLQRDPDSASLTNDSRQAFWERVAAANDLFTHSAVPGWRTDMGRVYILMGPPNDREWDSMPGVRQGEMVRTTDGDGPKGGTTRLKELGGDGPGDTFHGLERWTYDAPAGSGLPTRFVIAFRRRPDGDFVLSANPRDISRFSDSLTGYIPPLSDLLGSADIEAALLAQTQPKKLDPPGGRSGVAKSPTAADSTISPMKPPDMGGPPEISPNPDLAGAFNRLAIALDLGKIDGVPDPDRLMGELITSREFFDVVPLLLQPGFYKTTGRATVTALTVGIHRTHLAAGEPELRLAARLRRIDGPGSIRLLSEPTRFRPSPDNGPGQPFVLYQALVRLPPGRYQAVVGIYDQQSKWIGSSESRLQVPAFASGGELTLSTITQARHLAPLEEVGPVTAQTAIDPFRVGHYELVPRMTSRYASGEELSIYYQVYGTTSDPVIGEPRLTATYRLFALAADGDEKAMGEPLVLAGLTRAAQGWSLPIKDWPHGAYRLAVTVRDEVSGATGSGQTVFSVGSEPTDELAAD
jgi:GWxTD domain-containing protein